MSDTTASAASSVSAASSASAVDDSSLALDPTGDADSGNSTDTDLFGDDYGDYGDDGYDDGEASTIDSAGNTIFFICIVAILVTILALGVWLWRRHQKNKGIGADANMTNFLGRPKNGKPSGLPISKIRSMEENHLPPYSPHTAAAANFGPGSPLPNYGTKASMAARQSQLPYPHSQQTADGVPKTPFSPFVPFSPVTAQHAVDPRTQPGHVAAANASGNANGTADDDDEKSVYSARSGLRTEVAHPQTAMDPETAASMGISNEVIDQAEPGISEHEIERRRAKAQRKLDRQMRREEGSMVERDLGAASPRTPSMHFKEIANSRRGH